MLSASNVGVITGGVCSDPEIIETKSANHIVKFRLAVDFAGSEGGKSEAGYFDVTYFISPENPNAEFIRRQTAEGKFRKGSQVHMIYRLNHERWSQEGQQRSRVSLIAENVSYVGANPNRAENAPAREAQPEAELPARW